MQFLRQRAVRAVMSASAGIPRPFQPKPLSQIAFTPATFARPAPLVAMSMLQPLTTTTRQISTSFKHHDRLIPPSIQTIAQRYRRADNSGGRGQFKKFIRDPGNYPIIACNIVAASIMLITIFRKIVYHPDTSFSPNSRFNETQGENVSRDEQAHVFREQQRGIARALEKPTKAILRLFTGAPASETFHLNFLKDTDVEVGLEATDYFDDGLYKGQKPTAWAANENNHDLFRGEIKESV